jgi:hypothetical protein
MAVQLMVDVRRGLAPRVRRMVSGVTAAIIVRSERRERRIRDFIGCLICGRNRVYDERFQQL